jgi:hypothetical protein
MPSIDDYAKNPKLALIGAAAFGQLPCQRR